MKVKLFTIRPHNRRLDEPKQAIQYPNGVILVGYDVWRKLNKKDDVSYEVEVYKNFFYMSKKYEKCTFCKMKPFYIPAKEPEKEETINGLY